MFDGETVLQRALSKLVDLGFIGSPELGKQLEDNYKETSLPHLIAEYWRTKSPVLGYLSVAACVTYEDFLDAAHRIHSALEKDTACSKYRERKELRTALRRALDALRAE